VLTHGKGPKDLLVRKYRRWRRGRLEWVAQALRSISPKMSLRHSNEQLTFAF